MWSSESNEGLIGDEGELLKDSSSSGSFKEDYSKVCSQFQLQECPFIVSSSLNDENTKESVKVMNCKIDRANWRAMLIAATATGSKIVDIHIHGVEIPASWLSDITKALTKYGTVTSLKLNYITFTPEGEGDSAVSDLSLLASMLEGTLFLEYVSMRNNYLTANHVELMAKNIANNPFLKALNLSSNLLGSDGVIQILDAVALSPSIQFISVAKNGFEDGDKSCIVRAGELLVGGEVPATAEATLADAAKIIGDINKSFKDLNKKRKKANLPDKVEGAPASGRIVTPTDSGPVLVNRNITHIDVSGTTDSTSVESYKRLSELLISRSTAYPEPAVFKSTIVAKGYGFEKSSSLSGESTGGIVVQC
jgi:hypothetical protein